MNACILVEDETETCLQLLTSLSCDLLLNTSSYVTVADPRQELTCSLASLSCTSRSDSRFFSNDPIATASSPSATRSASRFGATTFATLQHREGVFTVTCVSQPTPEAVRNLPCVLILRSAPLFSLSQPQTQE